MWCLRGYYFKMAPGTVKKAILRILREQNFVEIRRPKITPGT